MYCNKCKIRKVKGRGNILCDYCKQQIYLNSKIMQEETKEETTEEEVEEEVEEDEE